MAAAAGCRRRLTLNEVPNVFYWLFEGRLSVYSLLLVLGCAFLVLWWQYRDRRLLYALGAVCLAVLFYFLLDKMYETPREKVARALDEMAEAVNKHDVDALFRHFSDNFRHGDADKKAFRDKVRHALDAYGVQNAAIKDIRYLKMNLDAGRITVRFSGVADNTTGWRLLPCEADFVRESDDEWRMKAIRFYNPVQTDKEEPIPGL